MGCAYVFKISVKIQASKEIGSVDDEQTQSNRERMKEIFKEQEETEREGKSDRRMRKRDVKQIKSRVSLQ